MSTPFALISVAFATNPGKCFAEHVGVKAPGTAKTTTFLPAKSCSVLISVTPSDVLCFSVPLGILSPALMLILCFLF